MKIYNKFRLIVSYMTMILVCGNYWTILSSLGICKCGIWNWNRPRSQIVRREGRNGIRRRIGKNSNTDIKKEMSSVRLALFDAYFRFISGMRLVYFRPTSGDHLLSQRTRSRTQRALTVQMSAMTFTFFACWLPRNILLLIAPFFPKKFYEEYKRTIGDFMFMSGKLKLPWITI